MSRPFSGDPARLDDLPELLTVAELARVLRKDEALVRRLRSEGELRPVVFSQTPLLFWKPEVRRLLAASTGATIVGDPYARILELERENAWLREQLLGNAAPATTDDAGGEEAA